jgi:hypothetical protein
VPGFVLSQHGIMIKEGAAFWKWTMIKSDWVPEGICRKSIVVDDASGGRGATELSGHIYSGVSRKHV